MKTVGLHTLLITALLALLAAFMLPSSVGVADIPAAPASAKLQNFEFPETENEEPFKVKLHTRVGDFFYEDKEIEPSDWLVAEEIHNRKINASRTEKRAMMSRALRAGATYERAVTLCMPLVKNVIDEAEEKLYIAPKDAEITFRPDSRPPFSITRDKKGRRLDREKAFELICAAVRHGRAEDVLKLPTVDIEPEVKSEDLARQTYLRADFSTDFSEDNADRAHNIALALKKINGMKLEPGEEFSFNAVVGPRIEKNGFKQAKIISGGEYVLGFGGGVCQASTTVYNAALRAGMVVTSVKNHSLTSSYIEPSLDAMVNSGSADLKFSNPLDTPVYIAAGVSAGKARVRMYGEKNEFKIIPRSKVLSTVAPPGDETIVDIEHKYLPEDAESGDTVRIRNPKNGVKSEAYLEYYKDNILIRRVKIRSDSYKPMRGQIVSAP